jgi:prepilin peptidase CpaA
MELVMDPFLATAAGVAALGCFTDLRSGKIPNALTIPVLIAAPLARMAYARHLGLEHDDVLIEGLFSVGGAVVAAIVPLTLYRKKAIGAGDVKLFAALGALAQPAFGLEILTWAFALAALLAPIGLIYQGKLVQTLKNMGRMALSHVRPKGEVAEISPEAMSWFKLGPAIFLAVLVTFYMHGTGGAS